MDKKISANIDKLIIKVQKLKQKYETGHIVDALEIIDNVNELTEQIENKLATMEDKTIDWVNFEREMKKSPKYGGLQTKNNLGLTPRNP